MEKSLISIIVPVYNGELFIEACVNSIVNQSYKNLQIIVVDDGSTDQTLTILKRLEQTDSRIKIVHQSNGGVSKARNEGLKYVKGEWIIFVDADDTIAENYCKRMVESAEALNVDVLIARNHQEGTEQYFVIDENKKLQLACLSFDESYGFNIDAPWGKIFRSSIILNNKISFPENLTRSEDAYFCLCVYEYVKRVGVLNWFGYVHNEREGSLCRKYSPDCIEILDNVLLENEKWVIQYHNNDQDYYKALYYRVLPGIVECENLYFLHNKCNLSLWKKIILYRTFLERDDIKRFIRNISAINVSNKQYKCRLLFYKLKLSGIFIFLKGHRR